MGELISKFMPIVEASPQMQQLKLPKLKKVSKNSSSSIPKLQLPKLKKVEI
jgi:hypothetical protein